VTNLSGFKQYCSLTLHVYCDTFVLTAVNVFLFLCAVMPCSSAEGYQHFEKCTLFVWDFSNSNSSFLFSECVVYFDVSMLYLISHVLFVAYFDFFFIVVPCILIILKLFSPMNAHFIEHIKC
jgi:hypothetical protein